MKAEACGHNSQNTTYRVILRGFMGLEDYTVGRAPSKENKINYESKLGFRGNLCG